MLLKSSYMYFEYSKCRTFCEFLIYVYDWFLFSLPWQRSVIFSADFINDKWATFYFSLCNNAVVFVLYSSYTMKGLLLYYYYLWWAHSLETKCRFNTETDSLESVEFLCENQECIDNLVTIGSHSALISSGHFPKELRFQRFCFVFFTPPPPLPPCFTNVWCVQVELSKVWVCTYVEPWGEEPPHDGPHHTDTPDCTHVMTIFWYCLHTLSFEVLSICACTLVAFSS